MGGEQSCVETGGTPHSMGYILVNRSSKDLTLCSDRCACQRHSGFSANHGKFVDGSQPGWRVRAGCQDKCWMSGREGAAVCPEGWIRYDVDGGGTVEIVFNSGGWSAGMNCAAIQVRSPSNILAEVVQGSIESDMPTGFRGTDRHRQFTITLRDKISRISCVCKAERWLCAMQSSEVFGPASREDLKCAARGPRPDNVAVGGDTSAAVPHKTSEIMGCVNLVHDLDLVPAFPSVSSPQALKHALDSGYGNVKTGGPCAGVAIQRVWWLLHDSINPATQWSQAKAPCIATDVISWLRIEGFRADHLGNGWSDAIPQALRQGQLVLCVVHLKSSYHWVTLIGVHEQDVYVLDYNGIYRIPIRYFRLHVYCIPIICPGAAIFVERGRGIPNVGQGTVVNGFHGDPRRDNSFWEYPRGKALETPRWDTHDAASFCSHSRRDGQEGNLTRYKCLGHHDLVYGRGDVDELPSYWNW
jgi:hypothetical protein